jgi:hypothetical protein
VVKKSPDSYYVFETIISTGLDIDPELQSMKILRLMDTFNPGSVEVDRIQAELSGLRDNKISQFYVTEAKEYLVQNESYFLVTADIIQSTLVGDVVITSYVMVYDTPQDEFKMKLLKFK